MELQDVLGILRRRWWVVLLGVAVGLAVGSTLSITTPSIYRATSRLFVKVPDASTVAEQLDAVHLSGTLLASFAKVMNSESATKLIAQSLDNKYTEKQINKKITAVAVPATLLLDVRATDRDPMTAARISNAAAAALTKVIGELQGPSTDEIRATIVDRAQVPTDPTSKPSHDILVGLFAGIVLGLAGAIGRDALDRTIREPDTAADAFNAPFIGSVPKQKRGSRGLAVATVGSPLGESYRVLRTAIRFRDTTTPIHTLLVTSAASGDGKSTVAANLALTMAQDGARVILIDADLRRSRSASIFDVPKGPGLTDVLLGKTHLRDALVSYSRGLRVLQIGQTELNPSEALGSQAMVDLLDNASELAEIVIIDSPPVLPVADPAVLAALVDATVVVTRWGRTTLHAASSTRQVLENVGAVVIGVVINAEGGGRASNYYEHYNKRRIFKRRNTAVEGGLEPAAPRDGRHRADAASATRRTPAAPAEPETAAPARSGAMPRR